MLGWHRTSQVPYKFRVYSCCLDVIRPFSFLCKVLLVIVPTLNKFHLFLASICLSLDTIQFVNENLFLSLVPLTKWEKTIQAQNEILLACKLQQVIKFQQYFKIQFSKSVQILLRAFLHFLFFYFQTFTLLNVQHHIPFSNTLNS